MSVNEDMNRLSLEKKKKRSTRLARKRLSVSAAGKGANPLLVDGTFHQNAPKFVQETDHDLESESNDPKCFTKVASKSQVGSIPFNPHKVNQDRAMVIQNVKGSPHCALFGVFDGHGMHGEDVSSFLTAEMPKFVSKESILADDAEQGLINVFDQCTKALAKSEVNCTFSGTTAVVSYVTPKHVYTANVGDSRAILVRKDAEAANGYAVTALSNDQKPDDPEERARIEKANGRVAACKGPLGEAIGPARVWLKSQEIPGLAMSRSFGDDVATSVGVTSIPEVIEYERTEDDWFMVLASDGVWEFLNNAQVAKIVSRFDKDPHKAAKVLAHESTKRWQFEEEVIDDITCVVVML